jgi:hypothetical protein
LSNFIQIRGKIEVHFLNKGGGYLEEDLHGEERAREWTEDRIVGGGASLERERRRVERKREEEERLRPNWYKRQSTSLIGALSCPKGASEGGAIPL